MIAQEFSDWAIASSGPHLIGSLQEWCGFKSELGLKSYERLVSEPEVFPCLVFLHKGSGDRWFVCSITEEHVRGLLTCYLDDTSDEPVAMGTRLDREV